MWARRGGRGEKNLRCCLDYLSANPDVDERQRERERERERERNKERKYGLGQWRRPRKVMDGVWARGM